MDLVSICVASTYLVLQVKAVTFSRHGTTSAPEGSSSGAEPAAVLRLPVYPRWADAGCNQLSQLARQGTWVLKKTGSATVPL